MRQETALGELTCRWPHDQQQNSGPGWITFSFPVRLFRSLLHGGCGL